MTTPLRPTSWQAWAVAVLLAVSVFALRSHSFDFRVWNVDEAIHASVARILLDGGVLYHDAIDQRTPLTYYAVAALFGIAGENNVWAMHALAAALIATTAFILFLIGRSWRGTRTGLWAAVFFTVFSTALFYPGDAYALNTEWFVALFTAGAAWAFWRGSTTSAGGLFALAFLSKQPALLDLSAPLAVLLFAGINSRSAWGKISRLLLGFAAPLIFVFGYFAAKGVLGEFHFYAWNYNLHYYGPEISFADRVLSAFKPFQLLGTYYSLVLMAVIGTLAFAFVRVVQWRSEPTEREDNPKLWYLLIWSATSLAGAASGGRGYDHYLIQLLPPFCLAAGMGLEGLLHYTAAHRARRFLYPLGLCVFAAVIGQLIHGVIQFRTRAHQPMDPSVRVAEFIKAHTDKDDRIFVWGYHPDIYLFADRKPASRFVYGSFLSGLIPWTNTAPERDTAYAIVPGARATLLRELNARRPVFIVDCSAGPNRYWQKYPLDTFPDLRDFISENYQLCEPGQFVPQGFRLFKLKPAGAPNVAAEVELPPAIVASLAIGVSGSPVTPAKATAPYGASFNVVEGRAEYFAHAPSRLVYRLPAGTRALRGGFGLRAAAYATENQSPSDGAEFIIRWQAPGQPERTLLRRLLQPRTEATSRGVQSFRVEFPAVSGAELVLSIEPGPADNASSDWTFWSDLLLEASH